MKRSGFGPRKSSLRPSPFQNTADRATGLRRSAIKAKGKKAKTKAERERMGIVAGSYCIVCRNEGLGESPAELHHPRFLAGGGQRSSHMDVIALCAQHHRLGGWGIAYHAGPEEFERRYGTERELLEQTKRETGLIEQLEMEEA